MGDTPTHAWQLLHPPLACHDSGWLEVGEGHAIYWECSGHPSAPAALFLHGGPGAASRPEDRRWFDPQRWRIVLFDQRGCGRARAADPLHANTTPHLVADIEALRLHLGTPSWLLFGGSWGATLALAYAQQHPQRVRGLVLRGVFTATRAEAAWLYGPHGAARHHPAAWQRLLQSALSRSGDDLLDAMQARLEGTAEEAQVAAQAWWRWEQDLMAAESTLVAPLPPCADSQALAYARIGVHYARHHWFIEEGQLLAGAARLRGLPGSVVQGLRDLVTPPPAARALQQAWPDAQWHEVRAAGHAASHPFITRQLIAATDAMAAATETHHALPARHAGSG